MSSGSQASRLRSSVSCRACLRTANSDSATDASKIGRAMDSPVYIAASSVAITEAVAASAEQGATNQASSSFGAVAREAFTRSHFASVRSLMQSQSGRTAASCQSRLPVSRY